MWSSQQRSLLTMRRGLVATRPLSSQIQPFFLVNAVSSLVIVTPAFAPQQDMNARKAVAHARFGDLFQALPHRAIVARLVQVAIDRAVQKYGRTSAPLRDAILRQQHTHQLPALPHLQSFFLTHPGASVCPESDPPRSVSTAPSLLPAAAAAATRLAPVRCTSSSSL